MLGLLQYPEEAEGADRHPGRYPQPGRKLMVNKYALGVSYGRRCYVRHQLGRQELSHTPRLTGRQILNTHLHC